MPLPAIPLPKIAFSYDLTKDIIDPRIVPICVENVREFGIARKTVVYFHNYGTHFQITIMKFPLFGKPEINTYDFPISKPKRRKQSSSKNRVSRRLTTNVPEYVR